MVGGNTDGQTKTERTHRLNTHRRRGNTWGNSLVRNIMMPQEKSETKHNQHRTRDNMEHTDKKCMTTNTEDVGQT